MFNRCLIDVKLRSSFTRCTIVITIYHPPPLPLEIQVNPFLLYAELPRVEKQSSAQTSNPDTGNTVGPKHSSVQQTQMA